MTIIAISFSLSSSLSFSLSFVLHLYIYIVVSLFTLFWLGSYLCYRSRFYLFLSASLTFCLSNYLSPPLFLLFLLRSFCLSHAYSLCFSLYIFLFLLHFFSSSLSLFPFIFLIICNLHVIPFVLYLSLSRTFSIFLSIHLSFVFVLGRIWHKHSSYSMQKPCKLVHDNKLLMQPGP